MDVYVGSMECSREREEVERVASRCVFDQALRYGYTRIAYLTISQEKISLELDEPVKAQNFPFERKIWTGKNLDGQKIWTDTSK